MLNRALLAIHNPTLIRFMEGFVIAWLSGIVVSLSTHETVDPFSTEGRATIGYAFVTGFLIAARQYFVTRNQTQPAIN